MELGAVALPRALHFRLKLLLPLLTIGGLLACREPIPDPPVEHVVVIGVDGLSPRGIRDAHTPNIVTVMIADYRSFDTLGEVMVVFVAGLACFLMLRGNRKDENA